MPPKLIFSLLFMGSCFSYDILRILILRDINSSQVLSYHTKHEHDHSADELDAARQAGVDLAPE